MECRDGCLRSSTRNRYLPFRIWSCCTFTTRFCCSLCLPSFLTDYLVALELILRSSHFLNSSESLAGKDAKITGRKEGEATDAPSSIFLLIPASRDQMSTLRFRSGRLVGFHSHIRELQERLKADLDEMERRAGKHKSTTRRNSTRGAFCGNKDASLYRSIEIISTPVSIPHEASFVGLRCREPTRASTSNPDARLDLHQDSERFKPQQEL